jgi:hypothetical protein
MQRSNQLSYGPAIRSSLIWMLMWMLALIYYKKYFNNQQLKNKSSAV